MKKILKILVRKTVGPRGSWLDTRQLFRYLSGVSPYKPRFSWHDSDWRHLYIVWTGVTPREIDPYVAYNAPTRGHIPAPPNWCWTTPWKHRNDVWDLSEPTEKVLDRLRAEQIEKGIF